MDNQISIDVWSESKIDTLFNSGDDAWFGNKCIVTFKGNEIKVTYDADEGSVSYKGNDHGHGHYFLTAPEVRGSATLHQVPDQNILEGHWVENGYEGMWRITLAKRDSEG